jgi:O-antigen ligase
VFFYHELVTEPVNAIHVSVYVAMAFFYFFNSYSKNRFEVFITFLLFAFLILLSSKNILVVFSVLVVINYLTVVRKRVNRKIEITVILLIPVIAFLFFGKIKDRFDEEFQSNYSHNSSISQFENVFNGSNAISVKEAWNNEQFTPNDYFSGLAFRVFQIRVFYELLAEEPIIWKGFGLNAAQIKIDEKVGNYNLFKGNEDQDGYLNKNFHNQYIQVFAEIGFFGFLIMVTMLFFNTIKTIKNKDFIQIAFAVLMISLFLTESLLSRQRGIMFFVLLFCLFNSKKANAPETK